MFRGLQLQWQQRRDVAMILGSAYMIYAVNDMWFVRARIALCKSNFYTSRPMVHGTLRAAV